MLEGLYGVPADEIAFLKAGPKRIALLARRSTKGYSPSYKFSFHGHSRLREIHEHVPIARKCDVWLICMRKAIDRSDIPEHLGGKTKMMRHFTVAARRQGTNSDERSALLSER